MAEAHVRDLGTIWRRELAEFVGIPAKERRAKHETAGSGRNCIWARSGGRCDEGWLRR